MGEAVGEFGSQILVNEKFQTAVLSGMLAKNSYTA